MLAYHGTSLKRWELIQEEGILPRSQAGQTNWEHSIESNPKTVYLSSAYAPYFGLNALNMEEEKGGSIVVIEVDTDCLDPSYLVPDEDALEQFSRQMGPPGSDKLPAHWGMIERTRYYRGRVRDYAQRGLGFEWSMKALGTGGHSGRIGTDAFTRVAVVDIQKESAVAWAFLNCQVSILNYRFCGPHYAGLTKLLFGEEPNPSTGELSQFMPMPKLNGGVSVINLKE